MAAQLWRRAYDARVATQSDVHSTIVPADGHFPELLTQLSDPPPLLYVKGNRDVLHLPALAIVGSRNPTDGGVRNAIEFSPCPCLGAKAR